MARINQWVHRYVEEDGVFPLTECIECGASLTATDGIEISGRNDAGGDCGTVLTCLDKQGVLQADSAGLIASGCHAGTSCAKCGAPLDDLEAFVQ